MKRALRRDRVALVLVVLLSLLPLIALGVYAHNKHQWARQQMTDIAPRHARLAGLIQGRDALEQAEAGARARLAELVYAATEDLTKAGNDAQQKVRAVFSAAGLQVVSSQVLPAKDEKQFDRIPLVVRLEGEQAALQDALRALAQQKPVILLDNLNLQSVGLLPPHVAPRLVSQFSLSVLRLKP